MQALRIGVMGCSSFARRAMIPALAQCADVRLVAIASREADKANRMATEFGCRGVEGYEGLLKREEVDAIYMPLPTGLHEEWGTRALQAGKHLLVEKSFAATEASALAMVALARARNRLVFENFQFQTHSQWARLRSFMTSGEIGAVHLVRSTFGFPPLPKSNFRWDQALGGGALLDAGAYMAKAAQLLLGAGLEVRGAALQMDEETGVDRYGEAMLRNAQGQVAQVAFGFDYFYQCRLELLGTKGKVSSGRVFTAPPDHVPSLTIETPTGNREEMLPMDNHYVNMWRWFATTVAAGDFQPHWDLLCDQAHLLSEIRKAAGASAR
ncbi:MAG TPA: Gfo/Idh/MocA family oxidoreductase [Candidatus Hydrogenedentes bacterium]|jgi:predicted dehydrogenase|nr:Gfo/Idh/MocA family oxidoreductase [Candidatus Hydrogenedentota bacterium]